MKEKVNLLMKSMFMKANLKMEYSMGREKSAIIIKNYSKGNLVKEIKF